ncbi:MAG: peptidylprolyl isomerase [Clostridia bacterium]|nr:peptidylprolyl isomerase [Clostridia bacterium]
MKKISLLLALCVLCLCLAGCGTDKNVPTPSVVPTQNFDLRTDIQLSVDSNVAQKVKFTMTDGKAFIIETAPQFAPRTVQNFLYLVETGFYNGLTFHRVIDNFVAQGGDPKGDGTGGSSDTIPGEFAQNGFDKNTLSHTRGVVSMARTDNMNSATSQFFICYSDISYLDGGYAGFGTVVEGMDVIDSFLLLERDQNGKPAVPPVIATAEILK